MTLSIYSSTRKHLKQFGQEASVLMASQGPGECLEHWIRTSGYYCGQLKGTFGGGEKNFLKREFSVTQPTERLCSSLLVVAGAASLISEKQATTPGTQTACHGQAAQVVGAPTVSGVCRRTPHLRPYSSFSSQAFSKGRAMSEQTRALLTPPDAGTPGAQAPTCRRLGQHTAV